MQLQPISQQTQCIEYLVSRALSCTNCVVVKSLRLSRCKVVSTYQGNVLDNLSLFFSSCKAHNCNNFYKKIGLAPE